MKDKSVRFLIRTYMVLLVLSLAVNVQLFPIPALSVDSVPLPFFVVLAGTIFCGIFYRDFIDFLRERRILLLLVGLFLFAGILSSLFSPFPTVLGLKSLFHYGLFFGISFLLLFLLSLDGEDARFFFFNLLVALAVLLAVISFFEVTHKSIYRFLADAFRDGSNYYVRGRFRAVALQPNPNIFGCLMSLGILSAFYLKTENRLKAVAFYPISAILALALALSASRNAILILVVPLFLLLWNRQTVKTAAVVFGIALVALAVVTAATSGSSGIRKIVPVTEKGIIASEREKSRRADTISIRFQLWQSAWAMFQDHPLTGIGPGVSNRAMKDYASEELLAAAGRNIHNEYLNTHNGVLNILAEFGLAGAAAVLAFVSYLMVCFIRRLRVFPLLPAHALLTGIILSFLPDAFFYSLFYMSVVLTIFMLFAVPERQRSRHLQGRVFQAECRRKEIRER